MPIGIIINCGGVFIGGVIGALLGEKIPERVRKDLPVFFGICSFVMGIFSINKICTIQPVILAIILGTIIGQLVYLDEKITHFASLLRKPAEKLFTKKDGAMTEDEFLSEFVTMIVLFCASGTGIYGSIQSGMTGDHSILIAKAVLDFFTALIFATRLGLPIAAVAIPQAAIMLILFFSAQFIYPLTTPEMIGDFSACGGALMLITGFKIFKLLDVSLANMLPAMILVMPFSWLWSLL
ncbi:DUF554 domain-containing protein [Hominifimenecus sp. rT4P-3]|uniref:DUF554 domain-containing protein n=1 Tax=Hominifimenecus sp. rT4P-3 TaxID=3242979 RepID=UPI003DA61722